MRITIIGAGNGGQAMAGHFSLLGHTVILYARHIQAVAAITQRKQVVLTGDIEGVGKLEKVTDNLAEAVSGAEVIMIVTTADAHKELAQQISGLVEDGQVIVLNPGRTLGALEFSHNLKTERRTYVAEAQTLMYACRTEAPGRVRVIRVKDRVLVAARPAIDTEHVVKVLNEIHDCFMPAKNILVTGLENIGAVFHPAIVIMNTASIEQGKQFNFYKDISPSTARLVSAVDKERLAIGESYGLALHSAEEWVTFAYSDVAEGSLLTELNSNPAYSEIPSPTSLDTRYLVEDVPTGILPMVELAKVTGVKVPLLSSILTIGQCLLGTDFSTTGRTLDSLGIGNLNADQILKNL